MPTRPFDPQWTTDHVPLNVYLDKLCLDLESSENRSRARSQTAAASFKACIRAIVLDLYRAYEANTTLEVGIASGTTRLQQFSRSRYGASFLSARTFKAALKAVLSSKLIVESTKFWNDPGGKDSRVTHYQASPVLIQDLRASGASPATIRRHSEAEGIILKDSGKQKIEYGDIGFANDARQRLQIINKGIYKHWIDLALPDEELLSYQNKLNGKRDDEASQPFDFAARMLHRVFNNNDWEQGGRFYGGWWITLPSELRKYILINGKKTVEVDYSGLHAAMLFAEADLEIPDDPYQRCLTSNKHLKERKLVKLTFNALLNATDIKKISPVAGYSKEVTGCEWHDYKQYIVSCYKEFRDIFCTGVGLRLQYMDSRLAEHVLLSFTKKGYACLPVHDSFIVHHALLDDLKKEMSEAFQSIFGITGKTSSLMGIGELVISKEDPVSSDCPSSYDLRLAN